MSKNKRLRKLIQKPLRFHHQDIHEELEVIKAFLAQILIRLSNHDSNLTTMPTKNTINPEHIEKLLDQSETAEQIFWGKELVVSYKLPNGFSVCGRGACVDPANFDLEVGRRVAREDAASQLWKLEGYLLQQRLFEAGSV